MGSIDQQRFEDMMTANVPGANLTQKDGVYQDEGVQTSWVGYRALHITTTCSGEDNHEDTGNTG